jgi:hypothetical protein
LLPIQSWDQYTGDLFGTDLMENGLVADYESFAIGSETLRETQEQIELWTTGNATFPSIDQTAPTEEAYICYGTVGSVL